MRIDSRSHDQIRKLTLTPHFTRYAEGSVLVELGNTKIICTASVDDKVPKWLQSSDKGWVGAEYSMIPRSTHTRVTREKANNSGRTQEISRLISRSLRAVTDLTAIKGYQVMVDCDVIQADGGTRTAAINGGFVALALAFKKMQTAGQISTFPLKNYVAAISVGVNKGSEILLDLCYEEDSTIETDMNFVIAGDGNFVEIQGTAEGAPFNHQHLDQMVAVARKGCSEIFKIQNLHLQEIFSYKGQ